MKRQGRDLEEAGRTDSVVGDEEGGARSCRAVIPGGGDSAPPETLGNSWQHFCLSHCEGDVTEI